MPPMAELLIARKAINTKIGVESYFGPIRKFPSTPRAVLTSVTDLKKSGLEAEQLHGTNRKLEEVAKIYQEVERLKEEAGYFDESDRLAIAAEAAESSAILNHAVAVGLYGFADLNELERRFVTACIERRPAYAFVPEDVASHTQPLVQWLERLSFVREDEARNDQEGSGPRALALKVFSAGMPTQPVKADVKIISAPSVAHEVAEIAREILTHARQGTSFSDIAVLLRNPAEYERTIRDLFDAAGIPYVLLDGIPAAGTLTGRLLRLLMRIRLGDYPRPDTMEFLGLAPLHPRLLKEFQEASPADWDRYSREAGIVKGSEQWKRIPDLRRRIEWRLGRLENEAVGEPDRASISTLKRDLASLKVFEQVIILLLKRLRNIPDEASVSELMGGFIRALVSVAHLRDLDRLVVKSLVDLAKQVALDDVATLEAFEPLLEDLLAERIPPKHVYRTGRVTVGSLSTAFGLPFKVVFIPGLVERSFPPPSRQDPVLLDHEREALNAAYGTDLRTREARAAEEQFYFRHALGAASAAVVLSYPRLDAATGQVRVPSHFLLRVAEALTGAPMDYRLLETVTERIPLARVETATPLTGGEWDLTATVRALAEGSPRRIAGLPGFPAIARGTIAEAARWGKKTFTPYDGMLGTQVRLPDTLAATQLETYGLCPFKFFGDRILGVREIDEPESVETLTPLDKGSIIHDILERFMSGLVSDGLVPLDRRHLNEYGARLRGAAQEVFEEFARSGAVGYPFMWAVEQARILTDLEAFLALEVDDSEGFVPAYFEARFGPSPWRTPPPGSSPAPFEVNAKGRVVWLTGFVDRIDLHPSGRARVIDYKSGAIYGEKDNQYRGGQSLQLPIYLLATDKMLEDNQNRARTEEAQYYYITSKGRFRRVRFTREALREREQEFKTILRTIVDSAAQGVFPQNPDGGKNCEWCEFKSVCGQGRAKLVERKFDDRAIANLRTMWEIE